jgi:hypothetical protein
LDIIPLLNMHGFDRKMDIMRSRKKWHVVIAIAIALIAIAVYIINYNNSINFEMVIPPDDMFINAVSSETCKEFDISFFYDDLTPPIAAQGEIWKKIKWRLRVFPKEGVEVKDFYCTLILDEWVLSQSSSPSLKYMGMEKGIAGDIPSESKGVYSFMEKFIPLETINTPEYKESINAPVRIMIAYNGYEEYYLVKPELKDLEEAPEEFQTN